MTSRLVTAQITEDGPLQGAEIRIWWPEREGLAGMFNGFEPVNVDVHLDAIGGHPARWLCIQRADAIVTKLSDDEGADR